MRGGGVGAIGLGENPGCNFGVRAAATFFGRARCALGGGTIARRGSFIRCAFPMIELRDHLCPRSAAIREAGSPRSHPTLTTSTAQSGHAALMVESPAFDRGQSGPAKDRHR